MRTHVAVGIVGAVVGVAVALAGHAAADAIDDTWPYGTGVGMRAPGFYDPRGGTDGVYTVTDGSGGADWYTARISNFVLPVLYNNEHIEVLSLLDDSAGYPHAGTVFDTTEMFAFNFPIGGTLHMFTSTVIDDPELGYAGQFTLTPFFINTLLITDTGMKDFVTTFGGEYTLFEIPFTDASGAGEASDAGDTFAQLLAELTGIN